MFKLFVFKIFYSNLNCFFNFLFGNLTPFFDKSVTADHQSIRILTSNRLSILLFLRCKDTKVSSNVNLFVKEVFQFSVYPLNFITFSCKMAQNIPAASGRGVPLRRSVSLRRRSVSLRSLSEVEMSNHRTVIEPAVIERSRNVEPSNCH